MKFATCHIDRKHHAKGLCASCYNTTKINVSEETREKALAYKREYSRKLRQIPGYQKNKILKHRYGITLEDYNKMLEKQNFKCALCFKLNRSKKQFHVDHDHINERVRGLLCSSCNNFMTKLDEDLQIARRAIIYKTTNFDNYISIIKKRKKKKKKKVFDDYPEDKNIILGDYMSNEERR